MRAEKVFAEFPENNCWRIYNDDDEPVMDYACRASVTTKAQALAAYFEFINNMPLRQAG